MNKKRLIEYIGCAAVILALFGFLYFDYNRPENKAKRAVRSVYESKYDAVLSKIDGATPASGTYLGISHFTPTLKEDVGGTHETP